VKSLTINLAHMMLNEEAAFTGYNAHWVVVLPDQEQKDLKGNKQGITRKT